MAQELPGSRSVNGRKDDLHVCTLVKVLLKTPILGVLGEVNLAELEDEMDPNDFYRALGVTPPKPGAVWLVYEYAGLDFLDILLPTSRDSKIQIAPQNVAS
jgi:hypothetical protein